MIQLLFLAALFYLFSILANLFGSRLKRLAGLNDNLSNYLIGWMGIFGCYFILFNVIRLLGLSVILLHWSSLVFFGVIFLLSIKEFKKEMLYDVSFWIVFPILMIFFSKNWTYAEVSFDSAYYFGLVSQYVNKPFIGAYDVYNHQYIGTLTSLYAFQSFYAFFGMIAYFAPGHYLISYVWFSHFLLYSLYSALAYTGIKVFRLRKMQSLLLISIILYIGAHYWNVAFSFYGNSYRLILLSLLYFMIIDSFNKDRFQNFLLIALATLAFFSVSSSGLFMVVAILLGYIYAMFRVGNPLKPAHMLLMLSGVFLYGIPLGFGNDSPLQSYLLIGVFILISVLALFEKTIDVLGTYSKQIVFLFYALVLLAMGYTLLNSFNFSELFKTFTDTYSVSDMVIDYFTPQVTTSVLLVLVLVFILDADRLLRNMFLYLILLFVSPFTYTFVSDFIAGSVAYRMFEIVLNPFVYAYALGSFNQSFAKIRIVRIVVVGVASLFFVLESVDLLTNYYHRMFEPVDNFDYLYRLPVDSVEINDRVNDILYTESLDNPMILSQDSATSFFVPNTYPLFGPGEYRHHYLWNTYDLVHYELIRQFYVPTYPGDMPLGIATHENTCELLSVKEVDFVIVRNDYSVFDETLENWVPIEYIVRECMDEVHDNETYSLYRKAK